MADQMARAQLLMAQQRYELAEQELRRLIGEHPEHALAFACLAICIANDPQRNQEATDAAQRAVHLEPDEPFCFYALSSVLQKRNHFKEALQQINEAIRLDPYDADYFGMQASINFQLREWQASLDSAEAGLSIDPEHSLCSNFQSLALERLGRGEDAVASAQRNIKNNPDDSYSHAALGWALLDRGQYLHAQESFREALRLHPHNEMAREGMITAINSRSLLFRWLQRWHTGLSRLAHRHQASILIGAWILITALGQFGNNIPWLAPLIPFILMAYMGFAVLTWTSNAIFNTFLRFHPFGRLLLVPKEIWSSNCVAACFVSALVGSLFAVVTGNTIAAIVVIYYWMLMCVPATLPFSMPTKRRALGIGAAAVIIGLIPVYGVIYSSVASAIRTFNWSIIGLQVVGGVLAVAPDRR